MLLLCRHNLPLPVARATTSGNGFNGTSSDGTTIGGSGTFSGSADSNDNFNGILNLQVTLGSDTLNGYANYSGSVDDSGNVSGSLDGRLATPFTIYNTGVDDNGTPLADGSVDPHYTISAAPSPYSPGSAYAVDQTSYPFSPHDYWLPDGDSLSSWIGPVANETNDPSGTYTYETTFDLTGYDSGSAIITGQYQSDNWLSEIILNGQVVASFPSSGASNFALWQALPEISSGFVAGENMLEFVTTNYVQATGNPTGFRVELQGSADQLAWQGPSYSWSQTPVANPTVTAPSAQTNTEGDNVSLQIQASDPNGYPLSYDAVDLPPGLSINSSTGLISGTVANGAAEDFGGSYNPTIIVANNQGGSTTNFSWTINQAQIAPVLTSPGDQSNLTGDNVNLQINATQADSDPISYDATNLPDGLSIDPDSGIISGTVAPDAASATPYAVTVTATDDSTNLSASQTFNWTITASTAAPGWTAPGDQSNAVGDDVDLQLSAGDANQDALTYTATGLPPGLTLDPIDATITGTLPASAASSTPYNVTVMASNGISSSSQSFQWTVNPISLQNPGDQSNLDGDTVSLPITATDANNATLSYSATGLPPGLSIDSGSGLISGAISNTADSNSPYSVTVTASDSAGNSASQAFNWTVAPLALNPINDQENQEGTTVSLQVSADDNVGTPTYSATGLPDGVSINSTTGLISGTVGIGSFGSSPYQVTVTATDGANTSSQSFVWTVTPRVALVNPGPQSNAEGDQVGLKVSATSPGGTMSYSATGLPDGLSINTSGLISGTLASGDASSSPYTVTVTANDGTSSSSQTFQWNVSVINLVSPGDQTNNDGDVVSLGLPPDYHGSGRLSYSATGLPPGLSIDSSTGAITGTIDNTADTNSPYSVTVTASDGTNTSTQTFNWYVNALVSIDPLDDQSNADGDAVSLQVSASDALNNTLSYSATGLPPGLSIASTTGLISGTISAGADTSSPYAVTVTVTDSPRLSATASFNWNVAPVGLVNPGEQASVDGQTVSLQLQGSSGATYTATGLPSGLSIDSSTGLISGTLASNADSSSPYTVTASATLGTNSVTQTFVWTATPVGLVAPSNQTNTEGDSVSLQLQGLSSGGSLTYSAAGLPNGLSLDSSSGLITGMIAAGDAANGPYSVDVAVTNGTVSASQSFNWNVNPVVNLTVPSDQNNREGQRVALQVSATDSLNNPLTYSADGLPSGLSIDSTTGLISGTIATGDFSDGPYAVTVTASDGTYSNSQTFIWNILQTNPTTPTMTNPGTQVNVAGDDVNLQINASDADGDTLYYSATNLPAGLSIDPFLGTITGTVADDAVSNTPYSVTVTATDSNGLSASQTFSWMVNAPASLRATASPVNAVGGNDTGSLTVAAFTTPDLNSLPSEFTATINWGDGTTDTGTVSGNNGSFTVTGDHTYAEPGSYAISVQISNVAVGGSVTVSTTATVTAATLTATGGFDVSALAGQFANATLATFTSSNANLTASDFTATIDWGDGSGAQAATVVDLVGGVFGVSGSHAYTQNGAYTAAITITGSDGSTANTTSTVTVGNVYAGIPSTLTVASFTDSDATVPASNFTATINWGDGTQSSGTVSGSNGVFTIQGTHTYAEDSIDQSSGVYTVTVTVSDANGDTLTSSSTVVVVRPPMVANADEVVGQPGVSLNDVQVAEFAEPDATDGASEFSATIDWGDGTSSGGTIQEVGAGLFEVLGTHTFATASFTPIVVSISQGWQALNKDKVVVTPKQGGNIPDYMLYSVTFNGGIGLANDTDGKAYEGAQWLDANLNGNNDAPGDHQYPIAYVSGSKMVIQAEFKPQMSVKAPPNTIRIMGYVYAELPQAEPSAVIDETIEGTAIYNAEAKTYTFLTFATLPKDTVVGLPLSITWYYSLNNGETYKPAGQSTNELYLTYQPMTENGETYLLTHGGNLQTLFADATSQLTTSSLHITPEEVLDDIIWPHFSSVNATRAVDGKSLQYYGNWINHFTTYAQLIENGDGQCQAWVQLLAAAIFADGLDSTVGWDITDNTITPTIDLKNNQSAWFLINNWSFTNKAGMNTNYFTKAIMGNSFNWNDKPAAQANDLKGTPGQNNPNPLSLFENHQVLELDVGTTVYLYDPSYGKVYEATAANLIAAQKKALEDLQNQAIAAFATLTSPGKDTPGELVATPINKATPLQLKPSQSPFK